MADNQLKLLLAVKADKASGKDLLGEKWADFFYGLRALLQDDGQEEPEDREDLLLFRFPDPAAALSALSKRLQQTKKLVEWEPTRGPAPLRIILELAGPQPYHPLLASHDSEEWNRLASEVPHLTPALKEQWQELADPDKIGAHRLADAVGDLTPLLFDHDSQLQRPPLFPHRHLPLQGKLPPCFYCGLTTHEPAACPAKMLTMQTQGLPTVGYLPLEEIARLFKKAMESLPELDNMLVAGISPGQLRKDPLLRVYVSYFDLNKVFQPRFLAGLAFTAHTQWWELGRPESIAADNSSLYQGLDCLRVGQHRQAEELFINESRRPHGKQLYATIGRALVALEQNRLHEMGHYLDSALKGAMTNKDRIFVCLLLYRYYRLQGDNWKAAHSLDNILSFERECAEAIYRQAQLAVAEESTHEAINRIRSLVVDERVYFFHVMMDPELLPIHDAMENILHNRWQNQRQEAEEKLAQARTIAAEMEQWLEPEAEELRELREDLAILAQQEEQQSYYDLIDIAEKSGQIRQRCYRLQESLIDALHERIEATGKRLSGFQTFWKNYQYQNFFPEFGEILQKLQELTQKTDRDGQKNLTGARYRALQEALAESEDNFKRLKELTIRLVWVRNLFNAGKQFIKSLVVAEAALLSLTVVLLASLILLSADSPTAHGLAEVLRDPAVQKRMLTMVTLILAPLLALIHTLWRTL